MPGETVLRPGRGCGGVGNNLVAAGAVDAPHARRIHMLTGRRERNPDTRPAPTNSHMYANEYERTPPKTQVISIPKG
jgi:hypothetical protein